MNHFFLWVGPDSPNRNLGKLLLEKLKSVEDLKQLQGPTWHLCFAAQKKGLGAFPNSRLRQIRLEKSNSEKIYHALWFGHAWSLSDGNQPPFSILERCPEHLSAAQLVEKGRENCDGVFALVAIDDTAHKIALASDLLGSFHIYYRVLQNGIAVSNSSALLAGLMPLSKLDPIGVQELCSNSIPNENRSLWGDVKKVRSGEILNIDTHQTKIDLLRHRPLLQALNEVSTYNRDPIPEVFNAIGGVLENLHSSGGRGQEYRKLPWATDLTGGNDSRALMAAILSQGINVASTVTGPDDDPDVKISESLAHKLNIPQFTRRPLGQVSFPQFMEAMSLTDGEFDAVEYAGIAAVHRQHIMDGLQFSLNGSYCELARGHSFRMGLPGMIFPNTVSGSLCARMPLNLQHPSVVRWQQVCSLKENSSRLFSESARRESAHYFPEMFQRLSAYSSHLPQHVQLDLIHLDLRMERWQGRISSSTNQLWPAISPWGFQSPLKAVLTTHPQQRRNGLLTRKLTFQYAPDLATEQLYTGNPAMPFSLRNAHKFFPVVTFFADRALNKIKGKFVGSGQQLTRSIMEAQSELCSDPEVIKWIKAPLLIETGLFNPDLLLPFLSPTSEKSETELRLWCRLLTIESALRRQDDNSRPTLIR